MARYTDSSCRLCRREGEKLFLKGERCYSKKCSFEKRPFAPGDHGQARKKDSEYGLQLREKQKTKRFYGILEKQFRNYYGMASKKKGITGYNLLEIIESRLDNVVYRLGLAASRAEARQLVVHEHFRVNDIKVNIPSYLVKEGDIIKIREKSKSLEKFKEISDAAASRIMPQWLNFDVEKMEGKIVTLCPRDEVDVNVEEHLIVELYSK